MTAESSQDSSHSEKIFLILNRDPSQVQGNTEKYYLCQYLSERCDLHVFAPLQQQFQGATNHDIPAAGILGVLLLNFLLVPYWLYHFIRERPDVVYCYENVILPAALSHWVFSTKVVFDLRSDPYYQAREFGSLRDAGLLFRTFLRVGKYAHLVVLRWADYVFVVSEPLADDIVSNYGVSRDAIRVLELGVDVDRFRPVERSYDRLSIVYMGALARFRGLDTLVNALRRLPAELQTDVRLDLYGHGSDTFVDECLSTVSEETDVVAHWHGTVNHEQLSAKAGKSDIAVSPLPAHEAFEVSSPAKVFEYLAMGLPVVASRVAAHERILDDGETALFYEPSSVDELSTQLERLLSDDKFRCDMASNARKKSFEYSWEERFSVLEDPLSLPKDK